MKAKHLAPLFGCCALLATLPLAAQSPAISSTSPQAVAPGKATDVVISGGNLVGVSGVWTSFKADATPSPDEKDNGKNAGRFVYRFNVPTDVQVGVHGIRVVTDKGVSPLRMILVDDLPSVAQAAGNTSQDKAQPLTLPIAVDGSVANLSRHYFKFAVTAGQVVSFEVVARRMGTALDPVIRILDAGGRELAYSDDAPGLSGDAQLAYKFDKAGEYVVEVRDIQYRGGGTFNFRLRMGDFPCVSVPYPMGVKRGSNASITFAGSSIDSVQPTQFTVSNDASLEWVTVGAKRAGGKSSGFALLSVGSADEVLEKEPNDAPENATRVTLGHQLNGRLEQARDEDRFIFAAKKGQKYKFTAFTRQQGSPADLLIRLLKTDGGQVGESEDVGTADSALVYTFPADGDYSLVVRDLHRRGGSDLAYRIGVTESEPGFELAASADAFNIPVGSTEMITVTAIRSGYNGPIHLAVEGLPAGFACAPTVLGPGINSVVLTVNSPANAAVGKILPARVVGTGKIGDQDVKSIATITAALKGASNNTPFPTPVLATAVAVGVAPAKQITFRVEPPQIVFGRDLNSKAKIIVVRDKGFDEVINFKLTPEKTGLPAGITAAIKPIPKGQNEIEIVFSATDKAPLGEFTGVINATIQQGKTTVSQVVPGIGLKLEGPFTLKTTIGGKLKQGGELKIKVAVERNPAFTGPVAVTLQNLPKGVTVAAATIAPDKTDVEVTLKAAKDATVGAVANIVAKGDAMAGKAKLTANAPNAALTVE
ncbi:MAG: hypothetical protein O3A00_05645 [Planctomycetota bacterium]|nr:hypothetical protein [Planctomycetota bacterium]